MVVITASDNGEHHLDWYGTVRTLKENGLSSVMIEGGGQVLNSLLQPDYLPIISMVGQDGVVVSPTRRFDGGGNVIAARRLVGAKWYPFGEDVILC